LIRQVLHLAAAFADLRLFLPESAFGLAGTSKSRMMQAGLDTEMLHFGLIGGKGAVAAGNIAAACGQGFINALCGGINHISPHLADTFQINGLAFGKNRAADEQAEHKDAVFHVCFLVCVLQKKQPDAVTYQAVCDQAPGLAVLPLIILVPRLNGSVGIARGGMQGVAGR